MKLIRPLLLFLICTYGVAAQTDLGIWYNYKINAKLSDNWSYNGNYQLRSLNNIDFDNEQTMLANGFSYAVSPNLSFGAGHRYLKFEGVFLEHGMYQSAAIKSSLNKLKITNRFTMEERWINSSFQMRYRAGIDLGIPLSEKVELVFSEEVFLINKNSSFEQNRIILKANYKISNALKLTTGIMHWQFSNLKRWATLLTLSHSLDIRKK